MRLNKRWDRDRTMVAAGIVYALIYWHRLFLQSMERLLTKAAHVRSNVVVPGSVCGCFSD